MRVCDWIDDNRYEARQEGIEIGRIEGIEIGAVNERAKNMFKVYKSFHEDFGLNETDALNKTAALFETTSEEVRQIIRNNEKLS